MSVTVVQAVTAERVSTLKTYRASELSTSELLALTARPRIDFSSILDTVRLPGHASALCQHPAATDELPVHDWSCMHAHGVQVKPIVEDVRARGDEAVREYTRRFDRVELSSVCVPIDVSHGSAPPAQPRCWRAQSPQVKFAHASIWLARAVCN